jgi:hypothetical protein
MAHPSAFLHAPKHPRGAWFREKGQRWHLARRLLYLRATEPSKQAESGKAWHKAQALLWPDSEPTDVRRALRNALSLLRSLLGEAAASLRGKGACHAGGGTLVLYLR